MVKNLLVLIKEPMANHFTIVLVGPMKISFNISSLKLFLLLLYFSLSYLNVLYAIELYAGLLGCLTVEIQF